MLRIAYPAHHPTRGILRPVPNDAIGFEYIPNAEVDDVKINSDGFRDDPLPSSKDSAELRILWLGDSIVMGWGVSKEDRFTDVLNSKLKARNPQVRTINLGVESYTNYQELLVMKRKGIALKPDIVILGFCWNDILQYEHFVDSSGYNRFLFQSDRDTSKNEPSFKDRLISYIISHSRLLDYGKNTGMNLVRWFSGAKDKALLTLPEFLDWYLSAWKSAQLDTLEKQIDTLQYITSGLKANFVIVMFPLSIQVDKTSGLENYCASIDSTQERFEKYCESHDISCYDMKSDLIKVATSGKKELYLDIWHFNKDGNEIAANLIYHYLDNGQLLHSKQMMP